MAERETDYGFASPAITGRLCPDCGTLLALHPWLVSPCAGRSKYAGVLEALLDEAVQRIADLERLEQAWKRNHDAVCELLGVRDNEHILEGAQRFKAGLEQQLQAARVAGPELSYTSNGEAGDGQCACSLCGQERDEPHTWEECARLLQRSRNDLADSFVDVEQAREATEEHSKRAVASERAYRRRIAYQRRELRQLNRVREKDFDHRASLLDRLRAAEERARKAASSLDRLRTVVDEAFGMQPVMETEELLTLLEHRLFEDRQSLSAAMRVVEAARGVASEFPRSQFDRFTEQNELVKALAEYDRAAHPPTPAADRPDTEPREPGCQCHWEAGDSPCPVHGDEADRPGDAGRPGRTGAGGTT